MPVATSLIYIQASSRVPDPRRETEVKALELFLSVMRACGLQGSFKSEVSPTYKPPLDWQFKNSIKSQESESLKGYPVAEFGSAYSGVWWCVLLHMWFYNMLLKFSGYTYYQWSELNRKAVVPTLVSQDNDSFQPMTRIIPRVQSGGCVLWCQ